MINAEDSADALSSRLTAALTARGDATALRSKRYGLWQPISAAAVAARSRAIARGLIADGFVNGSVAAVLGDNCAEWVLADFGIMAAGGISAGFDAFCDQNELSRLLNLFGAVVLFVAGDDQLHKALRVRSQCAALRRIIVMHQQWDDGGGVDHVLTLADLEATGISEADLPRPNTSADAALLLTSGTGAPARGARFTQGALGKQASRAAAAIGLKANDERLSLMPLHHAFERVVGIYAAMLSGTIVNFPESRETALGDLIELQPSVVQAPPRIWSGLKSGIELAVDEATPFQQWVCRKTLSVARSGRPNPLLDWLVLSRIRRRLGLGGARLCISGGAVLRQDVAAWFGSLGRPLTDVYGHAETAGAVSVVAHRGVFRTLDGVEVDIVGGEIRIRSDALFSGYADEGSTHQSGGWWRSGDAADTGDTFAHHPQGRLVDLAGFGTSPIETEASLVASPYISDAFLYRDDRDRSVAAILLNSEAVTKYAQDKSIPFTHFLSLCRADGIRRLIGGIISEINGQARVKVDDFVLIERAFSLGDPELGPAFILRRRLLAVPNAQSPHSHVSENV